MFDQSTPFNSRYYNRRDGSNMSPGSRKDPYQVLGIQRGATQSEIKSAYRKQAMKHHPDRVQGEEDKKIATAKFAEISAAYELLTTGDGGASHPSFADSGSRATAPSYADGGSASFGFQRGFHHHEPFINTFPMGFDPLGFGTFDSFHFTDPFELFRRTFGDVNNESSFGMPFPTGHSFMQQDMMNTAFGGFPSMFGNLGNMPSGYGTSTFSSSSYSFGGGGSNQGRMISTTTTTVNGKSVTRTEQTVIKPDGTKETVIDLTGDDIEDTKVPAIKADECKFIEEQYDPRPRKHDTRRSGIASSKTKSRKRDAASTNSRREASTSAAAIPNHSRKYKVVSKEELEQTNQTVAAEAASDKDNSILLKSHLSENETYVIDEKAEENLNKASTAVAGKTQERKNTQQTVNTQRRRCKRKFCDLMYRCLLCCFPPCKRKRVANDSSH